MTGLLFVIPAKAGIHVVVAKITPRSGLRRKDDHPGRIGVPTR